MEVPGVVQIHVTPSRREYCHKAILLNNLTDNRGSHCRKYHKNGLRTIYAAHSNTILE